MKSSPILRRWKTVDKNGRPAAEACFLTTGNRLFFTPVKSFSKELKHGTLFFRYLEGRGIIFEHTVYNSHDGPRLSAFSLYGMEGGR